MTLGRETLFGTLQSVLSQKIDTRYEIVIVLQGTLTPSVSELIKSSEIPIYIYKYDPGLWFWFYRNACIRNSRGDILVWIDDDEWANDEDWLTHITNPIREWKFEVVTSWCYIVLGQGYIADCISLIGYPGGWALWFEKVWRVDSHNTTQHLCGGNFAISRLLLSKIDFFETKCIHSCDDTHLAGKIISVSEKIMYEKKSTLSHVMRNSKSFRMWIKNRRKGFQEYRKIANNTSLLADKRLHICNILKYLIQHPKYIPWFLYLTYLMLLDFNQ